MSDTAQRLLDEAEHLVQARGYHAFSYADLSKAVGIKTASIHYHFPTKQDLVRSVVERYRERFRAALDELVAHETDPVAQIEGYFRLFQATFAQDERICVCASLAADALTLGSDIGAEVRGFFEDNETWLAARLEAARKAGAVRADLDSRSVARAAVAALEGSMLTARVYGSSEPIDHTVRWLRGTLT